MGIPVEPLNKIAEGSPHVVDWIERGDVDLVINTPTGTAARTDGYEIRRAAVARGIPCITTIAGGMAAARAIAAARQRRPGGRLAAGAARAQARRRAALSRRTLAPLGRRLCRGRRASPRVGAYDVLSVLDADGPAPGPGPVLHARRGASAGAGARTSGRSCRARSRCCATPRGRRARLPARGRRPGHAPARRAARRRRAVAARPARHRLRAAGARAGRPLLVGGGVGHRAAGDLAATRSATPARAARASATPHHADGADAAARARGVATDDGSVGHHGLVTELLGPSRGATPHAGSTPAGRRRCSRRCARCAPSAGVPAQLALESGMACGYGACFGCVVPTRQATCACASTAPCSTRRPGARGDDLSSLRHRARAPGHQRVGHVRRDRRAARVRRRAVERLPVRRVRLQDGHARAAPGQPAAAAVGAARRDAQLDRAPEQGARGLPRRTTCPSSPSSRSR